jgi:hypothetical protein
MNELIKRNSKLWEYLTPEMKELAAEGEMLLNSCVVTGNKEIKDFSYLVFPWGKLYEGFLKKIFLDLGFITSEDYYGNDIRIGKLLSTGGRNIPPHRLSIVKELSSTKVFGENLTKIMRGVWKNSRNLVFHFFPDNFYKIDLVTSRKRINETIKCMEIVVNRYHDIAGHGDTKKSQEKNK